MDVNVVAKGMGLDSRIGSKFLHAGAGFGGSCFPKDSLALIQMGAANGIRLELLESVIRVNHGQRARILEKVTRLVGGLRGKTIGVLGLAFKPNTDDLREAPAIELDRVPAGRRSGREGLRPGRHRPGRRRFTRVSRCAKMPTLLRTAPMPSCS